MREFEPTLPKGSIQLPENTTTLVIEDVPSDVAWKFITGGGKDLGTEEQKEQLIRMFEGSTKDNNQASGCLQAVPIRSGSADGLPVF